MIAETSNSSLRTGLSPERKGALPSRPEPNAPSLTVGLLPRFLSHRRFKPHYTQWRQRDLGGIIQTVPWRFLCAGVLNNSEPAAAILLVVRIQNLFVAAFARQTDAMTFAHQGRKVADANYFSSG